MLYSRCAKVCKAMGYRRIITYILASENGASLKASGWHLDEINAGGGDWAKCTRRIVDHEQVSFWDNSPKYPKEKKQRWAKELNGEE